MSQPFVIRPAQAPDFASIADLHVRSWHRAYDGEFPGESVASEVTRALHRSWTEYQPKESDLVLVVEQDGAVVGFAAVWCVPAPYVDNLHIIEDASGAGAGKALVAEMVKTLVERGHKTLSLTVFESNAPARAFYSKLGGVESEPFTVGIFGNQVTCFTVKWPDLTALS